jgi:hypothetical protein
LRFRDTLLGWLAFLAPLFPTFRLFARLPDDFLAAICFSPERAAGQRRVDEMIGRAERSLQYSKDGPQARRAELSFLSRNAGDLGY